MTCRPAIVLVLLAGCLPLAGCMPDDWNGEPYTGPGTPSGTDTDTDAEPVPAVALAGTWVSEGADLSDLFAADPFSYQRVDAEFAANGSYAVTSTDQGGTVYTLTGTWQADDAGVPATVTLLQATPYEAEAEGIWQVDGDVLTWEVVQTVPDYGFVPATPSTGFGSTAGPGLSAGANVQIYRSDR